MLARGNAAAVECNDGRLNDSAAHGCSQAWSDSDFDSAKATHGPWAGVATPFYEFCVHDANAVRVVKVEGFVAAPA